jgi:hypothetical protein
MSETLSHAEFELRKTAFWSGLYGWVAGLSALVFVFELGRRFYEWLRYGDATELRVGAIFPSPQFDWIGVQNIVDFFWNLQIWVVALALMMLASWIHGIFDEEATKQRLDIKQKEAAKP